MVDALGVLPRRRDDVLHQAAGHRSDRHHERVDTEVDRPAAASHGELRVLAHPENHIRRDLTLAEPRDGMLPGPEVVVDAGTRLARSHAR